MLAWWFLVLRGHSYSFWFGETRFHSHSQQKMWSTIFLKIHLIFFTDKPTFRYLVLFNLNQDCQDNLGGYTLPSELSSFGLNPGLTINCHPGVSQAGRIHISVCAVPRVRVKLGVPSASIGWYLLKIPQCPSRRVGELSSAPWPNYKFLPELLLGRQWLLNWMSGLACRFVKDSGQKLPPANPTTTWE